MACDARARNPRFLMPLFGQKTGFRARMNEIKPWIPCSVRCGLSIVCYFCNKFAIWLQNIVDAAFRFDSQMEGCIKRGENKLRDYISLRQLTQPSATRPIFWANLHFGHLPQNFNLNSWLTVMTNWLKWRFVQKRGRVADGWTHPIFWNESKFQTFVQKFQPESWLTVLMNCLKCPHGLDNIIIILMQSPRAWATLSSFWCNLLIVQKTRQSFRPRNVVPAIVELSEQ